MNDCSGEQEDRAAHSAAWPERDAFVETIIHSVRSLLLLVVVGVSGSESQMQRDAMVGV